MRIFLLIISVVAAIALCIAAIVGANFQWENEAVEEPVSYDGLVVRYIDVGQADATLVECEGKTMLIELISTRIISEALREHLNMPMRARSIAPPQKVKSGILKTSKSRSKKRDFK